ncbi:hypothetical protein HNY73_009929 [Argiope bruennichi]|uniref:CCHC-type domain-containing protein n=1 Tax=Argiope bruennichi TaxID=94029 RepID=A0A8T0FG54_ARGBR|nr:hypothetical protein HNY73_009929 [Argiope bruennichi]
MAEEPVDFIKSALSIQSSVFSFLENIPKLSKDNSKRSRDYMVDFVSIISRQQSVIQMVLQKLHEKSEFIESKLETLQGTKDHQTDKITYTNVAKKDRQKSRSRRREEGCIALLYSEDEERHDNIKEKIQSAINPAKINVGIRNARNLKKGGIAIPVTNQDEIKRISDEIENNEILKKEIMIKRPKRFGHLVVNCPDKDKCTVKCTRCGGENHRADTC